jgi:hypothetical protein
VDPGPDLGEISETKAPLKADHVGNGDELFFCTALYGRGSFCVLGTKRLTPQKEEETLV